MDSDMGDDYIIASTTGAGTAGNAAVSQSGTQVKAGSESYHGTIPVAGSTSWGLVVTGSNPALSALACSLS